MERRTFLGLWLPGAVAGVACGSIPALANTRSSPDELARAVLAALQQRDRAALDALALNEQEFRDHVWPELPAARPERNLPFSYVWGDLHQKSNLGLASTMGTYGGRRFQLLSVAFSRESRYPTYVVHHESTVRVKGDDGALDDLRVCGSMLAKDGAWKVFSYVTDN
jgi:hypothetical protein